jgi:hypothetical protein
VYVTLPVDLIVVYPLLPSITEKWVLWSDTMLCRNLFLSIKHSVYPK